VQPERLWQMARPVSTDDDGQRRRLDVVLDLNMNEDNTEPQVTDDWMRRHTIMPNNKPTTTTTTTTTTTNDVLKNNSD